jgi:hypothetical protein
VAHITYPTNITLSLLANGKAPRHHGYMDEYNEIELGMRLLPGVDLALWVRIIGVLILALIVGGVVLATTR